MSVSRLRELLDAHRQTPESVAHEFRLSVGELVISGLHDLGWTQKDLARSAGVSEALVSRFLNGDHNWTSESVGKLLFPLGIRVRAQRAPKPVEKDILWFHRQDGTCITFQVVEESKDGETQITLSKAETS